eukprot:g36392.t1
MAASGRYWWWASGNMVSLRSDFISLLYITQIISLLKVTVLKPDLNKFLSEPEAPQWDIYNIFLSGVTVAELEAKGVDLELQQRGPSVAIVAAGDEVNMEATITNEKELQP